MQSIKGMNWKEKWIHIIVLFTLTSYTILSIIFDLVFEYDEKYDFIRTILFRFRFIDCALIYFFMPQLNQIKKMTCEVKNMINGISNTENGTIKRHMSSKISLSVSLPIIIIYLIRYVARNVGLMSRALKHWNIGHGWIILITFIDSTFSVFTTLNVISIVC